MPTKIILATRLDPEEDATVQTARQLAKRLGEELVLLYVAEELATVPRVASFSGVEEESVREQMLAEAREAVDAFVRAHLSGQPVRARIGDGEVVEEIVRIAREENADFLVVGTEGRGTFARIVLGSTTQEILHRAPCPVVVVPCSRDSGSR